MSHEICVATTPTALQSLRATHQRRRSPEKMISNFVEVRPGLVPGGCPLMNTVIESDDGNPILRARAQNALQFWTNRLPKIICEGHRAPSDQFLNSSENTFSPHHRYFRRRAAHQPPAKQSSTSSRCPQAPRRIPRTQRPLQRPPQLIHHATTPHPHLRLSAVSDKVFAASPLDPIPMLNLTSRHSP